MSSSRQLTRSLARTVRNVLGSARDAALGRSATAREFWAAADGTDWKLNSHWNEVALPGWCSTWERIGLAHLGIYERFARACQLPAPQRVLEWGVGGGANAVRFAALCEEFVAVDVAPASLEETARQVAAAGCAARVTPVLVSIDDQTSAVAGLAGSIDLFLCFYVLELLPSEAHALEIVRAAVDLLRPGGAAILQVKYGRTAPRFRPWKPIAEAIANSYVVDVVGFWTLLSSIGYEVRHVELVPRNELDGNYAYFCATKPRQ